ncbi:MAG: ABC-2 family transporter protein [Patescibacteria group bacterium]
MNKFLSIVSFAWQRALTFRFTIFMYRFGEIAESVVLCIMWIAIYAGSGDGVSLIKGFTVQEMVTYIFIGNILTAFTRSYSTATIARDIFDGTLSMSLVKPISYIRYVFYDRFGATLLVLLTAIVGQLIASVFFLDYIIFNPDLMYLLVIVAMLFLAYLTEFLLNTIIGTVAFWVDDVDGLFSMTDRVRRFFAGGYFPLSILPTGLAFVATLLPFAYTFYVPAQLYLQKISIKEGIIGLGIQIVWIALLYMLLKFIWNRGIRKYEGVGL